MKILYDILILGNGHVDPAQRTGIFRAIESLAEELLLQPECDVTFCINSQQKNIQKAKNYLSANSRLSHIPFSTPRLYDKQMSLAKRQSALIEIHGDWKQLSFVKNKMVRMENKALHVWKKMLKKLDNRSINAKDLANTDIYHSHFYASFDGLQKAGIKRLFLTSYDIIPILFPQYCMEGTQELMLSTLNRLTPDTWVVCISEATRNDLLNYMGNRLDPNKVSVTELAASHLFYQSTNKHLNQLVRSKYGVPDAPYILSLCTLEPRKNIDQAIRAFVQLVQQENVPDLNLVLVGAKGWKFQKIFDAIDATEEIKQRIYITGYMADEDLAAIYSDALMFVYPSFYEGFGLPPLEAMQCGVPVITSNTSSLPEVVGDAGIMVPPTDLDALCGAMLSLYKNQPLRDSLIDKSLHRAKLFSWKRCAEKTAAAYKASLH